MLYYAEIPKSCIKLEEFDERLKKGFEDCPMRYSWTAGETVVEQKYYVLLISFWNKVSVKEMKLRFLNMFGSVGKVQSLCASYGYIDQSKPMVGTPNYLAPPKVLDDSDVEIWDPEEIKDSKKRKVEEL